jgi:DNA-binding protein H-NS
MIMDISRMALADLQGLLEAVSEEIEQRRAQQVALVKEELAALARARGFKLEEIMSLPEFDSETDARVARSVQSHRAPAPIKYRHPHHAELVWSGRGKTPRWINAWMAGGNAIQELAVK